MAIYFNDFIRSNGFSAVPRGDNAATDLLAEKLIDDFFEGKQLYEISTDQLQVMRKEILDETKASALRVLEKYFPNINDQDGKENNL